MIRQTQSDYRDIGQFVVGEWTVDPGAHTVFSGSTISKLEPKAMQVLVHLAANAGSVVTRSELEGTVWAGMVVGYDALSNTIIKIRKAFFDQVKQPRIVETIPKSGYRLIAPVSGIGVSVKPDLSDRMSDLCDASGNVYPALPEQPSVAVLRFKNLAAGMVQDYLCDGLAEDIILDLSKLSGLFVIASNSSFVCDYEQIDPRTLSRELGVQFIVTGIVRPGQKGISITLQLIDGTTGGVKWAERYDIRTDGLFNFQDNVRRAILDALKLGISTTESNQLKRRGTDSEESYHHFLHGRELDRQDNKTANQRARKLFHSAISCDSGFSDAYSYLSRNLAVCFINRWSDESEGMLQSAIDTAQTAVQLDGFSSHGHFALGASTLWLRKHETALNEAEQAISLDPNFAEGFALRGMIQMYSGEPAAAISSLNKAMRLDPFYRDAYLHIIAQAYFHNQQYPETVRALKNRLIRKPDSDTSRVLLAATYAHQGNLDSSRLQWKRALEINPDYSLEHKREILPYRNPQDFRHFESGLLKAGVL